MIMGIGNKIDSRIVTSKTSHNQARGVEGAAENPNPVERVAGEIASSITQILHAQRHINYFDAIQRLKPGKIADIYRTFDLYPDSDTNALVLEALCQIPGLSVYRFYLEAHLQRIEDPA